MPIDFFNPLRTGGKSNAKVIPVELYPDEGQDDLYVLSQRQAAALLRISQYLEWRSRYHVIPMDIIEKDDFDAWNGQIKQRLMKPMEICAEIINCLETDEDTQNAFKSFLSNYISNNGLDNIVRPRTTSENTANLAGSTNPSCDLDILWSQCKYIVSTTHATIVDTLQKFETLTNPVELTQAAIEVIPAVGETLGTPVKYIALIQSWIAEDYEADYTTTPITGYEDMLACEIFCACREDCEITIDRVFNILLSRVVERFDTEQPILDVLNELAAFLLGIDTGGAFIADCAFLLVWGGLKLANFIIGGLLNRPFIGDWVIKTWLELAANNPDPDWVLICQDCGWSQSFNLRDTLGSWSFVTTDSIEWGVWTDTVGVESVYGIDASPSVLQQIIMRITIPATIGSVLDKFSFNYDLDKGFIEAATTGRNTLKVGADTLWSIHPNTMPDASEADYDLEDLNTELITGDVIEFRIIVQRKFTTAAKDGYGRIHTITLSGTGDNPFV